MKFRATVLLNGKTATGIRVPPNVVERLDSGKKPPVRVTINGYTYRSTVGVMGGESMLPLSAEHRKGAGVEAGDEVDVNVELDTALREVTVPADFAKALKGDPAAREKFDALSYSNQRRHVLSIEGAKTAETRARRVAKAMSELGGG